jgi:uncharacterized membrane protein
VLYIIIKWLHILLAITAVGANITYGVWLARAAKQPEHLPFTLRGVQILDERIANPCYILLLVTGFAMAGIGPIPVTTPWLLVSLILFVINILLGFLVYTPLLRRQIRLAETEGPQSAEYQAVAGRGATLGMILSVFTLIIIFMMVVKPSLWS